MNNDKYVYIIICDNSISSLGFNTFDKAEQWLFKERSCKRVKNEWKYINGKNIYLIKEIKILFL